MRDALVAASQGESFGGACARSRKCVRATSCRSRRPSPSRPPARRWASRPRRWRRSTTSRARSRTSSRCARTASPPPAREDGRLTAEIVPVYVPPKFERLTSDNGIRADTTIEQLAALKPVFDRKYGTVTAGNSSPLTDGASAVLLMSEEQREVARLHAARAHPQSYAYAALDPGEQLLHGSRARRACRARSAPGSRSATSTSSRCTRRSRRRCCATSRASSRRRGPSARGSREPVGEVDRAKLNVMGGSIAIGHPFGATGGAHLTTLCNELARRGGQFGLMTVCAAGGMGHAMVIERA